MPKSRKPCRRHGFPPKSYLRNLALVTVADDTGDARSPHECKCPLGVQGGLSGAAVAVRTSIEVAGPSCEFTNSSQVCSLMSELSSHDVILTKLPDLKYRRRKTNVIPILSVLIVRSENEALRPCQARAAGTAAPETDEFTGKMINPHNPEFITKARPVVDSFCFQGCEAERSALHVCAGTLVPEPRSAFVETSPSMEYQVDGHEGLVHSRCGEGAGFMQRNSFQR